MSATNTRPRRSDRRPATGGAPQAKWLARPRAGGTKAPPAAVPTGGFLTGDATATDPVEKILLGRLRAAVRWGRRPDGKRWWRVSPRAGLHGGVVIPGRLLWQVINRDGLKCCYCRRICNPYALLDHQPLPDYPTVEHVTPRSQGGRNTMDNLRVACRQCNERRGCGPVPGV